MKTIDIADAPFGTVVGGVELMADTRLMVVRQASGDGYAGHADCLVLASHSEWYPIGEIQPFTGDGWLVYSDDD